MFLLLSGSVFSYDPPEASRKLREEIQRSPRNSLAHLQLGESLLREHNYQAAASEFEAALNGDPHPAWIDVWAHIEAGEIFDVTRQRDRALLEYHRALRIGDDTDGAHAIAAQRLRESATAADLTSRPLPVASVLYLETPKPLVKANARYSPEAKIAELEGTVVLTTTITEAGFVSDLLVVEPLGLGLDEEAKVAAERWKFKPGTTQDGPAPMLATIEQDFLLPSKRSHWHLVSVKFELPERASRPRFVQAGYPGGDGAGADTTDVARALAALRRQALVTLSFDVDPAGHPNRFRVERASEPGWGNQAVAIVSKWKFTPGFRDGTPLSVPCTINLVWGDRKFTHASLSRVQEGFHAVEMPR